jgi:ABC-type multidrug transport system ATPase subunit
LLRTARLQLERGVRRLGQVARAVFVPAVVLLQGITCRFGETVALDRVDLEIEPGRVTGIVGPNGAGKTTLMDVVCGLVRPNAGRLRVLGHDVKRALPAEARRKLGVVTQETTLYDELTPHENLELAAALYGVRDAQKRIGEALAMVDLQGRSNSKVAVLSGGMKRRLAIARAFLHEPELLLLDEPTLGVDVEGRHQVWNHVRRLRDAGRTILLATNYLDEAEALCDDVAVVRKGAIVARDAPSSLVARAGRCLELECGSAGDASIVHRAVSAHPQALRAELVDERVRVYFDEKNAEGRDELVKAASANVVLKGLRVRSPDLMEVLRVIGEPS